MKRITLSVALLAVSLAACGGLTGRTYVDEANTVCSPVGGIIDYSYGESYDVVICKDGVAHEIPSEDDGE